MDETANQVKVLNYPKSSTCKCGGYMGGRFISLPGEIWVVAAGGWRDTRKGQPVVEISCGTTQKSALVVVAVPKAAKDQTSEESGE
jgi:hypothetical protein